MRSLRPIAIALSIVCHAAIAAAMMRWEAASTPTFDGGKGTDTFNLDGAISITGPASLGAAAETVRAVEAQDLPTQAAQAAIEEVKSKEEIQNVIASKSSTATEVAAVEEVREDPPQQKQVAVEEVVQQEAKPEQFAGSKAVAGGDPGAIAAYKGALWKAISKNQVVPNTREAATVKVSFRLSPKGELIDWRVVSSTGSKAHVDASVNALKKTSPFPPLPAALAGYDDPFEIEFRYRLQ